MIDPTTLHGFFDYLPEEMVIRQFVSDTWRQIFEAYGYGQLKTPSLEYADVLFGKYGEEEKLVYHFKDFGDRHVALRYDQTVPLARVVAQYLNKGITLPFKRYEISRVWRADAARKARKREFYQCDADIVGTKNLLAEAEILMLLHDGFNALGLDEHVTMLSHRKILEAYLDVIKISKEKVIEVYRSIDKLDKLGTNGVEDELKSRKIPVDLIPHILDFIQKENKSNSDIIKHLHKKLQSNAEGKSAIDDIEQVLRHVSDMGMPTANILINTSLVRGLDYYTGTVFEVTVAKFGTSSLAGGGRYDNLLHTFTQGSIPAVGVGIGFEPICLALAENGLSPQLSPYADVLITVFQPSLMPEYLKIAQNLRKSGLRTDLFIEAGENIGKQLKYADKKQIPWVLIYGPDEQKEGVILIKNMKTGQQERVSVEELLSEPRKYIKSGMMNG